MDYASYRTEAPRFSLWLSWNGCRSRLYRRINLEWIMLLIALKRPDLVSGLVGMAADPDFTEELIWNGLSELEKNAITNTGTVEITWGGVRYTMTKTLIEDGRKNLLIHDMTGGEKVVKNSLP